MDDRLRAMARQAVADAGTRPAGVDELRHTLTAVRILRDADGRRLTLPEYVTVIKWAEDHPAAAEMAAGSVVASDDIAFIKTDPDDRLPWACTDGGRATDEAIDRYLGLGASALRVGTGKD